MKGQPCARCRLARIVVSALVLGAAAGAGTLYLGLSREISMTATFLAALVPLLWSAKRNRLRPPGAE